MRRTIGLQGDPQMPGSLSAERLAVHHTFILALIGVAVLAGANAEASDVYDAAVAHAGRPAADLKRDAIDHPAEVLRLSGIKPGMQVDRVALQIRGRAAGVS